MSENTRPQDHISLKLREAEGELTHVTCTIATPTIKRGREYRRLQRAIVIKTKGFQEQFKARLRADETADDNSQIEESLNTSDMETFNLLSEQCAVVINVPNTKDGKPRDASSIDWEDSDLDEIKKGVDFFGQRLNANTSDT